jgi:2-oxoglutarate dehydrogenase E2 component (dihydrolipoamide succinyltransferase)
MQPVTQSAITPAAAAQLLNSSAPQALQPAPQPVITSAPPAPVAAAPVAPAAPVAVVEPAAPVAAAPAAPAAVVAQNPAAEIAQLCFIAGHANKAAEYIQSGATPETVRQQLVQLQAAGAGTEISSVHAAGVLPKPQAGVALDVSGIFQRMNHPEKK